MSIVQFIKSLNPREENCLKQLSLFRSSFFYDYLELLYLPLLEADLTESDLRGLVNKAFDYGLMCPFLEDDPEGIIEINPVLSMWLKQNYDLPEGVQESFIAYYEELEKYLFKNNDDHSPETYLNNLFWVEVESFNLLTAADIIMRKLRRLPSFNNSLVKMLEHGGRLETYFEYLAFCKRNFENPDNNQYLLYCYCVLMLKEGLMYKAIGEQEKGMQVLSQALLSAEGLKGSRYYELIIEPIQKSNGFLELEWEDHELQIAEILEQLSNGEELSDQKRADLYQNLGMAFWQQGKTKEAQAALEQASTYYTNLGKFEALGRVLMGIGLLLEEEEAFPAAISHLIKARDYLLQVEKYGLVGRISIAMGRVYSQNEQFEAAESCLKEAVFYCDRVNSIEGKLVALEEMAWLQNTLENQEDSAAYFLQTISLAVANGRDLNQIKMIVDSLAYPIEEGKLDVAYYEDAIRGLLAEKYSKEEIDRSFSSQ